MYRIYIFNEEFMKIIFNFGNNDYKYNEILEKWFQRKFYKIYLFKRPKRSKEWKKYSKLKVRVGRLRNEEREAIQYIGYVEGV